jgi:hypothetical protein
VIELRHITVNAAPPNNSMELTGRMRHVPCKRKSKGHAAFACSSSQALGRAANASLEYGHEASEP